MRLYEAEDIVHKHCPVRHRSDHTAGSIGDSKKKEKQCSKIQINATIGIDMGIIYSIFEEEVSTCTLFIWAWRIGGIIEQFAFENRARTVSYPDR